MKVIQVRHAGGEYPVYVGQGLLGMTSILDRHLEGRVLVVSDQNVAKHYLDRLRPTLSRIQHKRKIILPAGEEYKTVASWQRILDELVELKAQRDATILALGGGVVGDMAGFAAASYMRGIRVIQMPTTLLAQVDAAVGGKTGVNHPQGKNLIGAFHQPAAVIADLDTLQTLDERDYRAGLAEVVKYGAIRDPGFFAWLDARADALAARVPDALVEAVYQSVRNKAEVVAADEKEAGQRALLNFGHTFGHALETFTAYQRYRHGEAVAIGMVLAARLSEFLGRCPTGTSDRLERLLQRLGLDTRLPADADPDRLLNLMRLDKKNRADQIRLILLDDIGQASVTPCPADDIREVLVK
ncbi:3-dehydroquinate synthase [Wenzhouxiangella marina]|uniref:3-dehydroquinate synthase n=1 Tax=Wenzhouxiangella marina TaxID=1579979 RepID=A0A0K0XSL5_9GAMM|nr:3-dehydroquinate synthase [Wenzhouxiangella marina]AKS40678.1 3-dehydroquinate synthase [Wenzhouxiangella marina]MBB6088448.1 3-dehydroquinate synthase [Wenzhouxiangella marina]